MPSDRLLVLWLLAFILFLAPPLVRMRTKADGRIWSALRLPMILPLAGGLGLICFAFRSLVVEAILAPSAPVQDGLLHLRLEKANDLARLADDVGRAMTVQETPALQSELGMVLALQVEAAPDRADLGDDAAAALRASLRMAPANPYVWARLALVRERAGAQGAEILDDLRLSWKTGPNEERLRPLRIALALRHWPEVTPANRSSIFADIRNDWTSKPEELLPLARTVTAANAIRAALISDTGQLAAFEKALAGAGR